MRVATFQDMLLPDQKSPLWMRARLRYANDSDQKSAGNLQASDSLPILSV